MNRYLEKIALTLSGVVHRSKNFVGNVTGERVSSIKKRIDVSQQDFLKSPSEVESIKAFKRVNRLKKVLPIAKAGRQSSRYISAAVFSTLASGGLGYGLAKYQNKQK